MFFVGMAINIHSDHILRNLRRPGESGYKIPKGSNSQSLVSSLMTSCLLLRRCVSVCVWCQLFGGDCGVGGVRPSRW